MKFPKSNDELTEIFRNAAAPSISEFNGEYHVNMLTGLPTLKRFSHRKVFYRESGKTVGYNMLFVKKVWGYFFLEDGICKETDSLKTTMINYDRGENSFISNRIRDYVRCIEKNNLYIGRFYYLFMGKFHFLGYFSLSKE